MTEVRRSVQPDMSTVVWSVMGLLVLVALVVLYRDGLAPMVRYWETKEEYNHGYLIPVVAAYMLLLRADAMKHAAARGQWSGLILVLAGVLLLLLGELSALYIIIQYAFLVALVGLVVIAYGWRGAAVIWAPLAYLFFMIPLPTFLYNNLSAELQLVSSEIGVGVLRLAGVSVFLEGNVIDLGEFQLQVAEACSGLRYLFPLTSFSFLCAFLYRGPVWHKAIIFLSSIPITILMNSFRIGVIGILVEHYGIAMARGFLHDFEGWVIFMACVGILFAEIWLFSLLSGKRFIDSFAVDVPPLSDFAAYLPRISTTVPAVSLLLLFGVAGLALASFQGREELIPERSELSTFPLVIKNWQGRETGLEQSVLNTLRLDDYLMAQYVEPAQGYPVELYVAYYDSQRKGSSVHSPRACLPGGGWEIREFSELQVDTVGPDGEALRVNRALIGLGDSQQLVYYWFQQRGRNLTNEYLVKWFIFWDALIMNRTDGAMVRLVTPITTESGISGADSRLQQFARDIDPTLAYFIPRSDEVS